MKLALFVMIAAATSLAAAQATVSITSSSGLARAFDSGARVILVAGAMTNAAALSHPAECLLARYEPSPRQTRCTGLQCRAELCWLSAIFPKKHALVRRAGQTRCHMGRSQAMSQWMQGTSQCLPRSASAALPSSRVRPIPRLPTRPLRSLVGRDLV